jgi:ribonucleoside-diphosphate reductase alpha chain
MSTSIVDYIFRVLGVEYLDRYDLCHVKPAVASTVGPTDHAADEATPAPHSLSYTPQALAKAAAEAEGTSSFHASGTGTLDAHLEEMMGDAPVCDVCGHITVRNGACYRCLNCGNSMGCS